MDCQTKTRPQNFTFVFSRLVTWPSKWSCAVNLIALPLSLFGCVCTLLRKNLQLLLDSISGTLSDVLKGMAANTLGVLLAALLCMCYTVRGHVRFVCPRPMSVRSDISFSNQVWMIWLTKFQNILTPYLWVYITMLSLDEKVVSSRKQ